MIFSQLPAIQLTLQDIGHGILGASILGLLLSVLDERNARRVKRAGQVTASAR